MKNVYSIKMPRTITNNIELYHSIFTTTAVTVTPAFYLFTCMRFLAMLVYPRGGVRIGIEATRSLIGHFEIIPGFC